MEDATEAALYKSHRVGWFPVKWSEDVSIPLDCTLFSGAVSQWSQLTNSQYICFTVLALAQIEFGIINHAGAWLQGWSYLWNTNLIWSSFSTLLQQCLRSSLVSSLFQLWRLVAGTTAHLTSPFTFAIVHSNLICELYLSINTLCTALSGKRPLKQQYSTKKKLCWLAKIVSTIL